MRLVAKSFASLHPDFKSILNPSGLSGYWFPSLKDRIENSTAKAIHIPFKKEAILDAINQFGINNSDYPINGYGYYSKEAHQKLSDRLISRIIELECLIRGTLKEDIQVYWERGVRKAILVDNKYPEKLENSIKK